MSFDNWLAFALAYTVLSLLPGPSTMTVVAQVLVGGWRAALGCIAGDLIGGVVIVALAAMGLGAVLASSALAFAAVKWAGVIYLAGLGLHQILTARRAPRAGPTHTRSGLLTGFLTGVLNPKAIVFYMAFLAQFLSPETPLAPQMLTVLLTSSTIVGAVLLGYAALALRMAWLWRSPRATRLTGYASGSLMLGSSFWMASAR